MTRHSWLFTPAALSAFVLTSCGDQPTQPSLPADRTPVAAASAPAPDTWIPRAPDPVNRRGFVTASFTNYLGEQNVYVIGGYDPYTGNSLKLVEAYNVATNTWSRKSDLPFDVSTPNGAGVIHGGVFIAGGHRDTNRGWTTYGLWRYNLSWMAGRGSSWLVSPRTTSTCRKSWPNPVLPAGRAWTALRIFSRRIVAAFTS